MSLLRVLNNLVYIGNANNDIVTEPRQRRLWLEISKIPGYKVYFEGHSVEEPYDGLEFKSEEEEFYYNNSKSFLVLIDEEGTISKFPIPELRGYYNYDKVIEIVKEAIECKKKINIKKDGFVAIYRRKGYPYYIIEYMRNEVLEKARIYISKNSTQDIVFYEYDYKDLDAIEGKIFKEISNKYNMIICVRFNYSQFTNVVYKPDGIVE